MQALIYSINPIGWGTCKWLSYLWPGCLVSRLGGLSLRRMDRPSLPGDDWVLVRTRMGGICGTDVAILAQKQPPNSILQAFSSSPFLLGHENVAVVTEVGPAVDSEWLGRRVCVEPTLCCQVRGIDPPCRPCREGRFSACQSFGSDGAGTAGLPPGTSIGYNSRTGGSFGEYFVAHVSRLVPVPDELSDEQALLTDPVACSLHAVLRADLTRAESVLVYGTGTLGLGLIAALRAIGFAGRIDALEQCGYLRAFAEKLGADWFYQLPRSARQRFEAVAERTGGLAHRVRFGNYMLSGGYDVVFDCVGSAASTNETLKWTRGRGQVVFVATGHGGRIDLTPVWFRELDIHGAFGRQVERHDGRDIGTYELVHELMRSGKIDVSGMVTHTFPLSEYRRALGVAMNKAAHQAIKVAFDFPTNDGG